MHNYGSNISSVPLGPTIAKAIAEKAVAANAHADADIYHTISKDLICLQIVDIYKISGVVILLPYYIS